MKNRYLPLRYRTQIVLYTSIVSLLLTSAVILLFSTSFKAHSTDNLKAYGVFITKNVVTSVSDYLVTESYPSLKEEISEFLKHPNIDEIIVTDVMGKVVGASNQDVIGDDVSVDSAFDNIFIDYNSQNIRIVEEISLYGQPYGHVFVTISMVEMFDHIRKIRVRGFFIGLLVWVVSMLLGFFIAHKITFSLQRMVKIAEAISKGDFSQKSEGVGSYEIIKLSAAMNLMADAILERDIEQQKTNKEVSKIKNYLNNIIDSMPSVIIGVDVEGKVRQWNLEAEAITGIKAEIALGRGVSDVYPQISSEMGKIKDSIASREPLLNSKVHYIEKGETRFYDITVYPLTTDDVSGAVIRIDDVTEMEKKDIQFRQAQKMETVGTLAGGLAHDFNNVLGGIVGTLSVIDLKLKNHKEISLEELSKYVLVMQQAGSRATNMISQLLTLSRKHELSVTAVDLNTSIENILRICENSFDKSISLVTKTFDSAAMISADPTQIEQVLLNICVNASHAMTIMKNESDKWGGELVVTVSKILGDKDFRALHPGATELNYWHISIKDNGIGMSQETIPQVFTPFFTTKGKGRGTGLGLAMVYNIIKQHNGFIDVSSEEGVGSQFSIFLPELDEKQLQCNEHVDGLFITKGDGCVLVVDDEEIMQVTAKDILNECGYDVIIAKNGYKAIELYAENQNKVDIVLLDMAMPGLSGKDTFIELKKINPEVQVLLASGYRQDERVDEVLQLGVKDFIQKPYTVQSLITSIEKLPIYRHNESD